MPNSSDLQNSIFDAVEAGDYDAVYEHLLNNADPNQRNAEGHTLLMMACAMGHADIVALLVGLPKVAIDAETEEGDTALHAAIVNGHDSIVKFLVKKNANVNLANSIGATPLHLAIEENNIELVKFLLSNGADPLATDKLGLTPFHTLIRGKKNIEILKELYKWTLGHEIKTKEGLTLLHYAAMMGRSEYVDHLIQLEPYNVNAKTPSGDTPLHYAIANGHIGIAKKLLAANANPYAQNDSYQTPSAFAQVKDQAELRALVDNDILKGQQWLIEFIQALGYPFQKKGICFGLAQMGTQAVLLEDTDTFYRRLHRISTIYQQAKIKAQLSPDANRNFILEIVDALPAEQRVDLYAFTDGIELYHRVSLYGNDKNYEGLFVPNQKIGVQDVSASAPLVSPAKLEGYDDAISFSGVYTAPELAMYFSSLRELTQTSTDFPFVISLLTTGHAINIHFDKVEGKWSLLNANNIPFRYFKTDEDMAKAVITSLRQFDSLDMKKFNAGSQEAYPVAMRTSIQVKNQHLPTAKNIFNIWTLKPSMQQMHQVTPRKAKIKCNDNASWLHIASESGDLKTVKQLIAAGADVNLKTKKRGHSPAYLALTAGHGLVGYALYRAGAKDVDLAGGSYFSRHRKKIIGYSLGATVVTAAFIAGSVLTFGGLPIVAAVAGVLGFIGLQGLAATGVSAGIFAVGAGLLGLASANLIGLSQDRNKRNEVSKYCEEKIKLLERSENSIVSNTDAQLAKAMGNYQATIRIDVNENVEEEKMVVAQAPKGKFSMKGFLRFFGDKKSEVVDKKVKSEVSAKFKV